MKLRLGVLVSGRGTNLQAILDAIRDGTLDAEVCLVASNRPDAPALARAREAGIPTAFVDHRTHADRASFERELGDLLDGAGCGWLVLAGFLRVLTRELLSRYPERIVNVHPSLLPAFPGLDAQAQALAHGVRVTGCTVHLVDEAVDHGPILAQAAVPVHEGDTRDTLAARILVAEHALLVATLAAIARGELTLEAPRTAGERPRVVWARGPLSRGP